MAAASKLESIMEAKSRNSDLNDLSVSLHSIISDEAKSANIPFADEEDTSVNKPILNDSFSSDDSYPEKGKFISRRRRAMFKETGNEASCESDNDDGYLASEKLDTPGPLVSDRQRASEVSEVSNLGVMRRNSISMPVLNEIDLDALRNMYSKAVESSDTMESNESLTKITVSLCQS